MIVIVDYKAGNLASVQKAFARLGCTTTVTDAADVIARASQIVLPGVGHFAATEALAPVRDVLREQIARGTPFLGICVGMQWLFEGSEEAPETRGCGILPGRCTRFGPEVKSPHVGWDQVRADGQSRLLRGLGEDFFVYFTHSYRAPLTAHTVGVTNYGGDFAAAVECGNLFGVQFHPEKSGAAGLALLRNFVELSC